MLTVPNTRTMADDGVVGGEPGRLQRRPRRTPRLQRRAALAALAAVLLVLLLVGAALSQAAAPRQAGDYWPCPPRTHWECNE
jgi:hypothetical protein